MFWYLHYGIQIQLISLAMYFHNPEISIATVESQSERQNERGE